MRQNHIPRADRLQQRISKLESIRWTIWVPIGGGNPYDRCRCCHISRLAYYIANQTHLTACQYKGLEKQIQYYKKLLEEERLTQPPL